MSTIENRLRMALATRATLVTADQLRPAMPPTLHPARRPWGWVALAGATLAVVALAVVVTLTHDPVRPQQPSVPAVPSPSSTHSSFIAPQISPSSAPRTAEPSPAKPPDVKPGDTMTP